MAISIYSDIPKHHFCKKPTKNDRGIAHSIVELGRVLGLSCFQYFACLCTLCKIVGLTSLVKK